MYDNFQLCFNNVSNSKMHIGFYPQLWLCSVQNLKLIGLIFMDKTSRNSAITFFDISYSEIRDGHLKTDGFVPSWGGLFLGLIEKKSKRPRWVNSFKKRFLLKSRDPYLPVYDLWPLHLWPDTKMSCIIMEPRGTSSYITSRCNVCQMLSLWIKMCLILSISVIYHKRGKCSINQIIWT